MHHTLPKLTLRTILLLGLCPGEPLFAQANVGNARPSSLSASAFHPELLFAASDGIHGVELWSTLGLVATMVADLDPGSGGSYPTNIVRPRLQGPEAYFVADSGHGRELHYYDGSTVHEVMDIRPGAVGSHPEELTVTPSGRLYFTAHDGTHGRELWVCDLGQAPTLIDIDPVGNASPYALTAFGPGIVCAATHFAYGTELWISAGTRGTTDVVDIAPGPLSSSPFGFVPIQGHVFFSADDATGDRELWSFDGNPTNPPQVFDLHPLESSAPDRLRATIPGLVFTAYDSVAGRQLFHHVTSSQRVTNLPLGATIAHLTPGFLSAWFVADDPVAGRELWLWRIGQPPTLFDVRPGGSSEPSNLVSVGMTDVLFRADDGTTGVELRRCDGVHVSLVADVRMSTSTSDSERSSFPSNPVRSGFPTPDVYYFAAEGADGIELWSTNGTVVRAMGDLKPLPLGVTRVPNLHLYSDSGSLDVEITHAYPNGVGALIVGLTPTPPLPLPPICGALAVSPDIALAVSLNAQGEFATSFALPPVMAAAPLASQALAVDPSLAEACFSNVASTTSGTCSTGGLSATGEGSVIDDSGEYRVLCTRTDGLTHRRGYLGLYREITETGEHVLLDTRTIEAGQSVLIEGRTELFTPETTSDKPGHRLSVRLFTQSPAQAVFANGCLIWVSYC